MKNRILQACGRRTEKEVRALSERLANGQPLPRAISWEKEPAICFRPDASGKLAVRGSFDSTRSVYVLKDLDIASTTLRNRVVTAGNASFEAAAATSQRLILRNPYASIHDVYTVNEREPIGAGAFGSVLHAVEKRTGAERAIKKIRKEGSDVSEIYREVEALRMVNHPNVCKLIEYYETDKCVWLVMELCKGGDLCSYLLDGSHETIPEEDTARILAQMLMAVQHCHAKGLIHRDIKPENFLFATEEEGDPKRLLKLIDFGCSITFLEAAGRSISAASAQAPILASPTGAIAHCSDAELFKPSRSPARSSSPASGGTVLYMSPQALRGTAPTPADDMWSLGVVFHILLTGRFPFSTNDEERIRRLVQQGCFEDNVKETLEVLDKSHAASDLARRMLTCDPSQRITIEEALSHPFIAETIARMRSEQQTQRQTSGVLSFFGLDLSNGWLGHTGFTASHA